MAEVHLKCDGCGDVKGVIDVGLGEICAVCNVGAYRLVLPQPATGERINRAHCKLCGDVIESLTTHDARRCTCGKLMVDGGKDYIRRGFRDASEFEELSVGFPDQTVAGEPQRFATEPPMLLSANGSNVPRTIRCSFCGKAKELLQFVRPLFRKRRGRGATMADMTPRVSEYAARLREQMAFARGRCAAMHELDIEDRELPCVECRRRAEEVYAASPAESGG